MPGIILALITFIIAAIGLHFSIKFTKAKAKLWAAVFASGTAFFIGYGIFFLLS